MNYLAILKVTQFAITADSPEAAKTVVADLLPSGLHCVYDVHRTDSPVHVVRADVASDEYLQLLDVICDNAGLIRSTDSDGADGWATITFSGAVAYRALERKFVGSDHVELS